MIKSAIDQHTFAKNSERCVRYCPSRNGRAPVGALDNLFEIKAREKFNRRHMADIPRIKFFAQRRYRANWPFVDGHLLIRCAIGQQLIIRSLGRLWQRKVKSCPLIGLLLNLIAAAVASHNAAHIDQLNTFRARAFIFSGRYSQLAVSYFQIKI